MLARNSLATIVISLLPMTVALAQGETIEEVKKQITEKNMAIKSVRADMTMTMDVTDPSYSQKTESVGKYEYKRDGDKLLTRSESTSKTSMNMGGNTMTSNQKVLVVANDKVTYTMAEEDGQKQILKGPPTAKVPNDPFAAIDEVYDMKLLPSETIDGESTYVIEMTPKTDGAEYASGKLLQYFRKKDGYLVKLVTYDEKNKPISVTEFKNIEVNVPIDDSRFEFTPPDGVQVIDMTAMQQQMQQMQQQP